MSTSLHEGLKSLGSGKTEYISKYDSSLLEKFSNPQQHTPYKIDIVAPEVTSLCLAGNSLVDVCCDETKHSKGIPIKDLVGTEGLLFSFDMSTQQPVVKPYKDVRKTREQAETIRIGMESKTSTKGVRSREFISVELTPDHLVLQAEMHGVKGATTYKWTKANDLRLGDRILSDRRIPGCDNIRGRGRHTLIAEWGLGRRVLPGEDVHHINHNHFDNTPNNIEVKKDGEHFSHHQLERYGYEKSLDVAELIRIYNSDPTASMHSLAEMVGCDGGTIKDRLEGKIKLRTQAEIVKAQYARDRFPQQECEDLYNKGYTIYEIGEYYKVHSTTVSFWLKKWGVPLRESNKSRYFRRGQDLPALNHKVISISQGPIQDVYNLEVEGTNCFYANEILVHNCPLTKQPDFATFVMSYSPDEWCVESKSLKLYFFSYRQEGIFHEEMTNRVAEDLFELLDPHWIEVQGQFTPRGGIKFWPTVRLERNSLHKKHGE